MAKKNRICVIADCGNAHFGKGYCHKHYQRMLRGNVHQAGKRGLAEIKFLPYLVGISGQECIPWPFTKDKYGYGRVRFRGREWLAHRLMCVLAHGDPPHESMQAAHSCGKGHLGCVNPNHLRWATARENSADKIGHGTSARKLREFEVREIRKSAPHQSHRKIADEFAVSTSTVSDINKKKTWAWIDHEDRS